MKNLMVKTKKKVLIVATVPSMIESFNMDNIRILKEQGYEVHVACNFDDISVRNDKQLDQFKIKLLKDNIIFYNIPFSRNIGVLYFNQIIKSYKQLKRLLIENNYSIIHCHTPVAAAISRFAGRKLRKKNLKIIYTAHGFHFFKGGPIINWIIFYPVEFFLSYYTDILITINKDDFYFSKKMHAKQNIYIPGVGIDWHLYQKKFSFEKIDSVKNSLKIPESNKVLISIGELNNNKNHSTAIKAFSKLSENYSYIICGTGKQKDSLIELAEKLKIKGRIVFLGHVDNVSSFLAISDLSLFLSKREGLGLAGLEAMASGVPLVTTNVGGIKDYMEDGHTGYVVNNSNSSNEVYNAIISWDKLNKYEKEEMSKNCKKKSNEFDIKYVHKIMYEVYSSIS